MGELTHLSLFSGIGGLDLAAERAGFCTVGQCEWADYPTKVLEKHWPDVPRWRDIRTLTGGDFYERTGMRTVDVISGGFPCQPFSVAGKRRGKEDDRFLWPEMLRVIEELRPAWVVGENVAGIISMAIDQVLSDLESIGYTCQAFVVPACAVDAPHRRDRVCIVAYRDGAGFGTRCNNRERGQIPHDKQGKDPKRDPDRAVNQNGADGSVGLARLVQMWATPTAADSTGTTGGGNSRSLRTDVGGQLNPTWVEWLMGFPTGWTDLNA